MDDKPPADEMNGIIEYKEYEGEMDTSDEEVGSIIRYVLFRFN